LERIAASTGIIGDIRGKGLFFGIEFVKNLETKEQFSPPIGQLIGRRCLEHGLILRFDPHWIAMGPSLIVTEQDIDELLSILERSIREILSEVP
jgi:adenosylmethionine-8-amino-7-oxononanoate aminotransferase